MTKATKAKATRNSSAIAAASTSSSSLVNVAIIWFLMQSAEPGVELTLPMKIGVGCCACSLLSSIIRIIQYLVHFMTGIKTF